MRLRIFPLGGLHAVIVLGELAVAARFFLKFPTVVLGCLLRRINFHRNGDAFFIQPLRRQCFSGRSMVISPTLFLMFATCGSHWLSLFFCPLLPSKSQSLSILVSHGLFSAIQGPTYSATCHSQSSIPPAHSSSVLSHRYFFGIVPYVSHHG